MLSRYSINNVNLPLRKICSFFRAVKDDLGLRTKSAFSIPCECGQEYIGTLVDPLRPDVMSTTTDTYYLARQTDQRLRSTVSITITSLNSKNHKFSVTNSVTWTDLSWRRLSWSSPYNHVNREDGLTLSGSWKHVTLLLREIRRPSHCGA
jgi:hypothetical protein